MKSASDIASAEFDRALALGDPAVGTGVVRELVDGGMDPLTVMVDVIAAAQRRVGQRWQRGELTVAEEHAATGVSTAAVNAIARYADEVPDNGARIVLGCAEREWHALPASLVCCGLRLRGWQVSFLGPATSTARLASRLTDIGPDAAAVSCSVLSALPGCRAFIEAATGAGIPVVAGGAAFGQDDKRAMALGATAWAGTVYDAIEVIPMLPAVVAAAPALPAEPLAEQRAMALDHDGLLAASWARLRSRWGADVPAEFFRAEINSAGLNSAELTGDGLAGEQFIGDVLEQVLSAAQSALLTGDTRIIDETAWWVTEVLRGRGVPVSRAADLGPSLVAELHEFPLARTMFEQHWRVPGPAKP